MDDEQGPWWTRPPEPGPQAPPVQRRRTSGQSDVDLEYPPDYLTEQATVESDQATTEYLQPGYDPSAYAPPSTPGGPDMPAEAEPRTEPAATPTPPKPVIRRVAVVPPAPVPPPSTDRGSEDRTETLPAVPSDIFATFSGPLPGGGPGVQPTAAGAAHPPATGADHPPDGPPHARPHLLPNLLREVALPEPRMLLVIGAGGLVLLLIVLAFLLTGGGDEDKVATPPVASASAAAGTPTLKGKTPDGLKQLGNDVAAAQLRAAGQQPGGSIVEAWGWNDQNGQNLVVTSIAPAGSNKRTLRVIHVAGLDGEARTLRVMRDPNLPANCSGAGTAGFTPKALTVVDLDGDDLAEVVAGWSSRCGGRAAESQIKLAMITDGKKYIIRGEGVIGDAGSGTLRPDPRASRWPDGYLKQLTAHYRKLYG